LMSCTVLRKNSIMACPMACVYLAAREAGVAPPIQESLGETLLSQSLKNPDAQKGISDKTIDKGIWYNRSGTTSRKVFTHLHSNLSANCFSQLLQRMPAEHARLDIIINISSERLSPFSKRLSNNSTAEKAVFTILSSVHLSQSQLHTDGCCFTTQSLQIVDCLSFVFSSISKT
jgi:hypothetical protein